MLKLCSRESRIVTFPIARVVPMGFIFCLQDLATRALHPREVVVIHDQWFLPGGTSISDNIFVTSFLTPPNDLDLGAMW